MIKNTTLKFTPATMDTLNNANSLILDCDSDLSNKDMGSTGRSRKDIGSGRVGGNFDIRLGKKDLGIRIGSWNVRTLLAAGKLENLKREAERYRLDIVGISEARWKEKGETRIEDWMFYHSGGDMARNGVGIIVSKKFCNSVQKVKYISDRLIMIRFRGKEKDIVIVQVYMPTTIHSDEEVEEVYEEINEVVREESKSACIIVMGDFNAQVGKGKDGKEVGNYGYGTRNERGDRLIEFCREQDMIIGNTHFCNHPRRLYTWSHPNQVNKSQIDYILIQARYRNALTRVCTRKEADIDSDHQLLVGEIRLKMKIIKPKRKPAITWNLEKIKELGTKKVEDMIKEDNEERNQKDDAENADEMWRRLKYDWIKKAEKTIGRRQHVARKPWVTPEMISLMDEKRKWKNVGTEEGRKNYNRLRNFLRRETDAARKKYEEEECREIEEYNRIGRYDLAYNKISKMVWGKKVRTQTYEIQGKNGECFTEESDKLNRWKDYTEELYAKTDRPQDIQIETQATVGEDNLGPSILQSEVTEAIKKLGNGKTAGTDGIPIEIIKCMGEEAIQEITMLCNKIYDSGVWPEDFLKSTLIPIPKKAGTTKCEEHRTIAIISHAAKILLRILNARVYGKVDQQIGEEQFGFRKGRGTRDAIGVLRSIGERYNEKGKNVHVCFIDLEKAFDRVDWEKLLEILKRKGIDWKDRRLIRNLYLKQEITVKVGSSESEKCIIGRGVRQGCCLSPTLFNIYLEEIIRECVDGDQGVCIGGRRIVCIRFADDMALVAESRQELGSILGRLSTTCRKFGMKINVGKTKVMTIGKNDEDDEKTEISLDGKEVEEVDSFKYLGSWITAEGRSDKEIGCRIGMAKKAWGDKRKLLTGSLDIGLRKRLMKAYIWSIALYGCETWTVRKREESKLEAFEMWLYRRMLKIKWTDKVTNREVLNRVGEQRGMLSSIDSRKKNWLGHALRRNCLLGDVLEGSVEGKNRRGRRRIKMIDTLKQKVGKTYVALKRRAQDREAWRNI
jgi:hypothetical protein